MSPTSRPSAVRGAAGLRRGVGAAPEAGASPGAPAPAPVAVAEPEPKARVTLNMPASMYRDLERWATEAAGSLGVPRVGVQDALRGMIRACLTDAQARAAALASVRHNRE